MPHPTASLPSTASLPFVQYDDSAGAGRGGDSWAASGDWFAGRSSEARGVGTPTLSATSPSAHTTGPHHHHRRLPAKRTGMERWEDHLADFHVFPRGRRQEAAMRRAAARWTALEPLLVPLRNANSLPDNHRTATQTAKATMLYHNMPAEIFDAAAAAGAAAAAASSRGCGRRGGPRHTRERSESRTRRASSASASVTASTPRVGRTAAATATPDTAAAASPAASTRASHPQPWSGPAADDPRWKWRKLQDYHTPSDSSGGLRRRSVSGGGGSGGPGSRAARSKSARAAGSALHREFSRVMEGNVGAATEEEEHWLPQQQQQQRRRPSPPTSTLSVSSKGMGAAAAAAASDEEEAEQLPDTPVGAPVVLSSAAASATPAAPPLLQMPPPQAATAAATGVLGGGGSVGSGGGGGGGGRVADVPASSVHSTPGTTHHQHPRRPSVPVPYPSAADTNQADPPTDAPLASGPLGGVLGGSASFGSHEAATQRLQHGSSSAAGSVGFYPQPQPQQQQQQQHSSKPSNPYLMQASASDASGSDLDAPIRWTT